MKYNRCVFFLILLLGGTFSTLSAQRGNESNTLKIGAGWSHFNHTTDFDAPTLFAEFNRDFMPNTTIGVSLAYAIPQDFTIQDSITQTAFALRFGINMYYNLLDTRSHFALVGLGLSGGFQNNSLEGNDIPLIEIPDNSFQPGLSVNFEYNYFFTDIWLVGGRGSLFFYDAGESSWYLGAHLGRRF